MCDGSFSVERSRKKQLPRLRRLLVRKEMREMGHAQEAREAKGSKALLAALQHARANPRAVPRRSGRAGASSSAGRGGRKRRAAVLESDNSEDLSCWHIFVQLSERYEYFEE